MLTQRGADLKRETAKAQAPQRGKRTRSAAPRPRPKRTAELQREARAGNAAEEDREAAGRYRQAAALYSTIPISTPRIARRSTIPPPLSPRRRRNCPPPKSAGSSSKCSAKRLNRPSAHSAKVGTGFAIRMRANQETSMTTPLAAKIAREYGTPCAVIDMDKVERNIARIQKACDDAGVANRPHIKTHKNPTIAKMQVAAGAKGITCQKIGEAEIMANAGIDDILISYNLLGEEKMARSRRAAGQGQHDGRRGQFDRRRRPAEGRRDLGPSALGRGRMRHRPQARGRRDAGGSDCAGTRDRGVQGAGTSPASCSTRPRPAGPTRRSFSTRRWPACARTGSMPRSSRPAARRT